LQKNFDPDYGSKTKMTMIAKSTPKVVFVFRLANASEPSASQEILEQAYKEYDKLVFNEGCHVVEVTV
jgi:hypothetical protein